jgi:hypothetical protein
MLPKVNRRQRIILTMEEMNFDNGIPKVYLNFLPQTLGNSSFFPEYIHRIIKSFANVL